MKLYYPELDMSCFRILQALQAGFEHGIDYSEIRDFMDDDRMFWYMLNTDKEPQSHHVRWEPYYTAPGGSYPLRKKEINN